MRAGLLLVFPLLLLTACGGAPAAPTAAAPTAAPADPTSVQTPGPVAPAPANDTPAPVAATPGQAPGGTLCHLVTLDEIESATGLSATEAHEVEGRCTWLLQHSADANAGMVTLMRDPGEAESLDLYRGIFEGESVPGVGDEAYFVDSTMTLFFAHHGNVYIVTSMVFGETFDSVGINRAVALAALSRL
jgi:hypothetical protein